MTQDNFAIALDKLERKAIGQVQVLRLVLQGKTDLEIATMLQLEASTVRKHIERICVRFGLEQSPDNPRHSKRTQLFHLFARFKPEWVTGGDHLLHQRSRQAQSDQNRGGSVEKLVARNEENSYLSGSHHNLPPRDHTTLVGRENELASLIKLLQPDHPVHHVSIEGSGGVGKTSLLLEAAYHFAKKLPSQFEFIIFTSARILQLRGSHIMPSYRREQTWQDIIRTISRTLNCQDITQGCLPDQIAFIQEKLFKHSTLLIIDNLETLENREDILSFLWELPETTKVVLTTRIHIESAVPIRLLPLSKADSLYMIKQQLELHNIGDFTQEDHEHIYMSTGGLPAAIMYAIGKLCSGYQVKDALTHLTAPSGDFAKYCFEESVSPLRHSLPHYLLMSLSLFNSEVEREAIRKIANPELDSLDIADGLASLHQLSLIRMHKNKCVMLPVTRGLARAELDIYPILAHTVRGRWVEWCLEYVASHGTSDWREWIDYQPLEKEWETIRDVIEWCISIDQLDNLKSLWSHLNGFTQICGYWTERIRWMTCLANIANSQGDSITTAKALIDKGWTLSMINHPKFTKEAISLYKLSWTMKDNLTPQICFDIVIALTLSYINQNRFLAAKQWLKKGEKLIKKASSFDESKFRWQVQILYYQAQIALEEGFFDQAKHLYLKSLRQAEEVQWKRAKIYIKDWLALVAIKQANYAEAEHLLLAVLSEATQYQDRRCMAYTQRNFALLNHAMGNLRDAQHWGRQAVESFERLGMKPEATKVKGWLQWDKC